MLTIRKADLAKDTNRISELFHVAFDKTRFTPEFIRWKHGENPMGESYVMVAEENDRMVGVGCFVFWDVIVGGKTYRGVRVLDAAVHPDMQRRGIYKQLTLGGLELLEGKYDLLFGTPNHNSLHPLLKMGWKKLEQPLPIYVALRPLFAGKQHFKKEKTLPAAVDKKTADFIRWRYRHDHYNWAVFDDGTLLVYRVEKKRGSPMVILCDVFFVKGSLRKYVNSVCSAEKALVFMFLKNKATASLSTPLSRKVKDLLVITKLDGSDARGEFELSLGDLEATI